MSHDQQNINEAEHWVTVAARSALNDRKVIGVIFGEHHIAIYSYGGELYATSDICSHGGGRLHKGRLDGDMIICPLHHGCFDIKTGKALGPPLPCDIQTYPVRLAGDDIQVQLETGDSID